MTLGRWLETNLRRILGSRANRVARTALPAGAAGPALSRCLAALRPRNRWPENTRLYAALRARLAENPVTALVAFSLAAAAIAYVGLGGASLGWLVELLRGPV